MRYENLEVWKRSRKLTIDVYRMSNSIKDYGFRDQITRCCLSVPSNIAEGFEKGYEKEKLDSSEYPKVQSENLKLN